VIRVGVIGVNGIGQAHLWALPRVDGAELAAVCDVDDGRAAAAGEQHSVPAFTSAAALWSSGTVDAVVVATPPGTHGELVRAALDAGGHVYCEKPLTPTIDEARALGAHATDAARVLHVGLQFRFHTGYAALRKAVAEVAPVHRVTVTATNWFRAQQYFRASPWRATWRVAGGGVLMSQAVHQLDALIAAVGSPSRVRGHIARARHDAEVEDEAVVALEWPDGARGSLVASLSEPAGVERFEIVGESGTVVLVDGYDVRVARHDPTSTLIAELAEEFPERPPAWETIDVPRAKSEWFDMLIESHRAFVDAIRHDRPSALNGSVGAQSVELVNAIYLSALQDRPVELPLPEGEYASVYEALAAGRTMLDS
jgi:predicted dehydrogenase